MTATESRYKFAATFIDEPLVAAFRETGAGVERQNGHLLLSVRDLEHLNALIDHARAQGRSIQEVAPIRATLEDVFVDLIRTAEPESSSVGATEEGKS